MNSFSTPMDMTDSSEDEYEELRRDAIGGSHDALKWLRKLDKHLAIARAHKDTTMQIDTTLRTTSMSA